jgi:Secretion system C-terminal sorting domain
MKTTGSFIIAEPCHEDWNRMTPETQGRFCAACNKCVVDFTTKSNAEIQQIFVEKNGNVCGRMMMSQLAPEKPKARTTFRFFPNTLNGLQKFAVAVLTAFSFLFSSPVQAQSNLPKMGAVAYVHHDGKVEGKVKWNRGSDAAGALVQLYKDEILIAQTTTDDFGHYEFPQLAAGNYIISAMTKTSTIDDRSFELKTSEKMKVDLTIDRPLLGFVTDIYYEQDSVSEPPIVIPTEHPEMDHDPNGFLSDSPLVPKIIHLADLDIQVFPNPTPGQLNLFLPAETAVESLGVLIFDLKGTMLHREEWNAKENSTLTVDMTALSSGMYLLKIISGNESVERRIVKE